MLYVNPTGKIVNGKGHILTEDELQALPKYKKRLFGIIHKPKPLPTKVKVVAVNPDKPKKKGRPKKVEQHKTVGS